MKQTYENFKRIVNRSKEYEFESRSVLVLRDYYTGDEVRLDLSRLTPEMFDAIRVGNAIEEVWSLCEEQIADWKEKAAYALMQMDMERCSFELADNALYNKVELIIEDYCYESGIDRYDFELEPENVLRFNPEAQE